MITIGLTGGIASGKSVVAGMLAKKGAATINADLVGHESYAPGTQTYGRIVQTFGPEILNPDGQISRQALGKRVFGNPEELHKLEDIVWPEIRRIVEQRLVELWGRDTEVTVVEAAMLIEADLHRLVTEVWVVTAPLETARDRAVARSGLSMTPSEAEARMHAQLSVEERLRYANVVIDNSGTIDDLQRKVDDAWSALVGRMVQYQKKGKTE